MEEESKSLTSRKDLMADLETLKEVSKRNEILTKRLSNLEGDTTEIRNEIEKCVAQQSLIIDRFISLSTDEETLAKFHEIVASIDEYTRALDQTEQPEEIGQIREKILQNIEDWISTLEVIITGVISRAQD